MTTAANSAAHRALRFLALGDSYTIGEGVPPAASWPQHLARRLRDEGLAVEPPRIVAVTGWTTDELEAGIDAEAPRGPFDLVSLLIGVNDQYRGRTPEAYRPAFAALLARAVAFAGGEAGRVLVLSIPDWGVTPFAEGRDRARIAAEVAAFNAVNRDEAARVGAAYLDVTPASRMAGRGPAFVTDDGLHLSGRVYAEWVDEAMPVVRRMLAG